MIPSVSVVFRSFWLLYIFFIGEGGVEKNLGGENEIVLPDSILNTKIFQHLIFLFFFFVLGISIRF
jgi:hypothetical protein